MTTATKTRKKTIFGAEVFEAWYSGDYEYGVNRSNYSVMFEGDVIYSYGHHFPMAIRKRTSDGRVWYLVNGDTVSTTTSSHQAEVRRVLERNCATMVIIPFSALRAAGIDPLSDETGLELIDQEPERYIRRRRKDYRTGEWVEYDAHLLGASLFKANGFRAEEITQEEWENAGEERWDRTKYRREETYRDGQWVYRYLKLTPEVGYFLSGLDETGRDPWTSYFLAQLDIEHYGRAPQTVEEAYWALKPEAVTQAEIDGIEVQRQGEWFFVKVDEGEEAYLDALAKDCEKELKKSGKDFYETDTLLYVRGGLLQNRDHNREKRHKATRMLVLKGRDPVSGEEVLTTYVKGTIRHTQGQHRMLKLEGWYSAHENMQINSWVAAGRID